MVKLKAKKTKGKPPKRGFPWLWVSVAVFIAAFVLAFTMISQRSQLTTPPIPKGTRAAIVDQLYANYPNKDFTTKITQEFEDYGFKVDLYQGDDITVDLYRNLPTYGYKIIVFRAHSGSIAPDPQDPTTIIGTYLFTNEPYTEIKYPKEQLNDEISRARVTENHPDFFAIGPKFITHSMKGNFNDAVVIIAGCSCLYDNDLAQAFIQKGASAYLTWDATVNLDYVEQATISLIENLCSERLPVNKAVDLTMATNGADPKHGASLKYYPPQSGAKTLKELTHPLSS